jgi:uncharacterized iron-regulated membrane protein
MKEFLTTRPSETRPGTPDAPASQIILAGQSRFPESELTQITLPLRPTDAWRLQFKPKSWHDDGSIELAVIDRRSVKVLAARRSADLPTAIRAVLWLRPLHVGTFGGEITRVIWAILGLAPGLLFLTGLILWRKRIAAIAKP